MRTPPPRSNAAASPPERLQCSSPREHHVLPLARTLHGHHPLRHRSHRARAGLASGRRSAGEGRIRRRRSHCRQCRAGGHRAHDERHGRRPVRPLLAGEEAQTLRTERQRMGPRSTHHRAPQAQGIRRHAARRHRFRHRAQRGGRLERAAPPLRPAPLEGNLPAGDLLCRTRLSRAGGDPGLLAGRPRGAGARQGEPARLSAGWQGSCRRRDLPQSRPGQEPAPDRRRRRQGFLSRQDRARHRQHLGGARRHDRQRRPGRVLRRVGGPDLDHLSRLDRLRVAAQRTRHGRARNAQHHGDHAGLA